jgi:glycolate oxidase
MPKHRIDLFVPYNDFECAAQTVSAIIARGIVPTAMEFMEQDSLRAVERLLGRELPFRTSSAFLLFQLDGDHPEALQAEFETVGDLCLQHGAQEVLVAKDSATRDRLWESRRKIIDALTNESPINHMEDVVVPRSQIPALLKGIHQIAGSLQVRIISFGHAGDGNVHVNVLKDNLSGGEWERLVPQVSESIYRLTLSLGGMITGEHGIGVTRRPYLTLALGEAQVEVMRRIKTAFDPNAILNPAKIFP